MSNNPQFIKCLSNNERYCRYSIATIVTKVILAHINHNFGPPFGYKEEHKDEFYHLIIHYRYFVLVTLMSLFFQVMSFLGIPKGEDCLRS